MLYKTMDKWDLRKEFKSYDRDYYSLDGYQAILDLFEEIGDSQELDVIAICCDFNEVEIDEIRNDYDLSIDDYEDDEAVMDYLSNNTWAIQLDSGAVLYQAF